MGTLKRAVREVRNKILTKQKESCCDIFVKVVLCRLMEMDFLCTSIRSDRDGK